MTPSGINGFFVSFEEVRGSLEIDYQELGTGLTNVSVRPGTMLFLGTEDGDVVQGKAYIFHSKCGPIPYDVEGRLEGSNRLSLNGYLPKVDARCEATKGTLDNLIFGGI